MNAQNLTSITIRPLIAFCSHTPHQYLPRLLVNNESRHCAIVL